MSQQDWWVMAEEVRQIIAERVAEAEHDRLATRADVAPRPLRVALAGVLRALAARLDVEPRRPDGSRLAPAVGRWG